MPRETRPVDLALNELLGSSRWAADLSARQHAATVALIRLKSYRQGEYICHRGDAASEWFGVCRGLVKSMNMSASGKVATLTGVPVGGWFGEGSLLKNEHRRYDVIALRDAQLAILPKRQFDALLASSLAFNQFIIAQLNERLGQFIAMLEIERLFDPDVRTARTLAQLFHPHLYPLTGDHLSISQEEIGLLCGLSRPRANQALRVLEQEGLLRAEYGGVTVLNLQGLRDYEGQPP